jgi:hypothetical protein
VTAAAAARPARLSYSQLERTLNLTELRCDGEPDSEPGHGGPGSGATTSARPGRWRSGRALCAGAGGCRSGSWAGPGSLQRRRRRLRPGPAAVTVLPRPRRRQAAPGPAGRRRSRSGRGPVTACRGRRGRRPPGHHQCSESPGPSPRKSLE